MTEKLYYKDSHCLVFDAVVIDCREEKKGYSVVLDRTAFFPEGGGQLADTGTLGGVRVTDVHEKGGDIRHYTNAPLTVGECVHGEIDKEQRLRRMQNHSGEHILSGLVHNTYGYDNVGFHMGAECMIIDFSGELSWEQLMELETKANGVVRQNLPLHIWFPNEAELHALEYRSKLELTENVRIVEIPGVDRCACCAPHVERTGEVGVVKILDSQRHRGGQRVSVICGLDALEDYEGTALVVTHDEELLHAFANRLVVFDGGTCRIFEGTYADFLEKVGWASEKKPGGANSANIKVSNIDVKGDSENAAPSAKEDRKARADYIAERSKIIKPLEKQLAKIEEDIAKAEALGGELEAKLVAASESGDGNAITAIAKDMDDNKKNSPPNGREK